MVAAEQGNLEIAQELIKRGANVNLDDVVSAQTRTRRLSHTSAARVPSHRVKTRRSYQPRGKREEGRDVPPG